MLSNLKRILKKNKPVKTAVAGTNRIIITMGCLSAVQQCIAKDTKRRHEGVAYLIGQVIEDRTIAIAAICPKATTTIGSFSVTSKDMAHVIRTANKLKLHVVGQVHSHPLDAFHSGGDDTGANIAYQGYVSIVLPQYGRKLPSLDGAAFFLFSGRGKFIELGIKNVITVPEVLL
jgi:proteasome lid subunit RPN8/RPN11